MRSGCLTPTRHCASLVRQQQHGACAWPSRHSMLPPHPRCARPTTPRLRTGRRTSTPPPPLSATVGGPGLAWAGLAGLRRGRRQCPHRGPPVDAGAHAACSLATAAACAPGTRGRGTRPHARTHPLATHAGGAHFLYLSKLVARHGSGGWAVGAQLSIADILLFDIVDLHRVGVIACWLGSWAAGWLAAWLGGRPAGAAGPAALPALRARAHRALARAPACPLPRPLVRFCRLHSSSALRALRPRRPPTHPPTHPPTQPLQRIYPEQFDGAYPDLAAHHAKVAAVPGIAAYLASPLRLPKVNNNGLG